MALNIDPASIAEALRKNVESWTPVGRARGGRPRDRDRRRHRPRVGPAARDGERAARVPGRRPRPRLQPRRGRDRLHHPRRGRRTSRRATRSSRPAGSSRSRSATASSAASSTRSGARSTARARSPPTERRDLEVQAPNVVEPPAGEGAAVHRDHGDRRDDGDRARPARADHRRPPDRQDRRSRSTRSSPSASCWGDRAARSSASTSPIGQKASTVAEVVETLRENGALEYTVVVNASASDPAPFQYIAPYAGAAIGAHWMYEGEHALIVYDDLSKQAVGLPRALAAAAAPAGPRGLPGRRLLPALPPARARGEALRRARRRLADRAADHRDQGRRRLGVHPDERHLDHRRPDLPGARAVLLRRPAGDQRRHLGVAASAATRRSRR